MAELDAARDELVAALGPDAVLHDPLALRSGISFLRLGFAAAFLLAVYAVCLRDLLARQRAEEGA